MFPRWTPILKRVQLCRYDAEGEDGAEDAIWNKAST